MQSRFPSADGSTRGDIGAKIADEMRRHKATLRSGPRTLHQWVKWIVIGLALVFAIEGALSGTAVITQIDRWFLNGMRVTGLLCGTVLAWKAPAMKRTKPGQRVAGFAVSIVLCVYLFNSVAWRMVDWWLFTGTDARWEAAEYPLVGASKGRGMISATVSIDPFGLGDATEIPIPREQYEQVHINYRRYCVAVLQRKNSRGAIAVRSDGGYASDVQPASISACKPDA